MWRAADPLTLAPPIDGIIHSICDIRSLDPAYGSVSYRAWQGLTLVAFFQLNFSA